MTHAAIPTYSVSQEWVLVGINTDGSINVQYNITFSYLSGSPQGIFTVGMPKGGFTGISAKDSSGNSLSAVDSSSGGFYSIDVTLPKPISLNHPYNFLVFASVPGMVSPDSTNQGNVGMSFYPSTFPDASGPIGNVRVLIVLPSGVTSSEVKYPTSTPFDNVLTYGSNVAVYWERSSWPAAQQLTAGVSFPSKYVSLGPSIWFIATIVLGIAAIIVIALIILIRRPRRAPYEKPRISVEALGAARGLTAVEAAVVVGAKPVKVLSMTLFGLLKKKFISVKETTPLVKLEQVDASLRDNVSPRYYEIDFLKSIKSDGTLDEQSLARTYLSLRDNVDRKLRGYSRVDTVNYYKSVVDNAWGQVTQAGTPELKGDAIDQNLEWLMMDENYDTRFRQSLPPNIVILPSPGWWWYWHGPYFPRGPTPIPTGTGAPTQTQPIPAQEWANNIVRGMQTATNGIVKNVQDFTNRLVPQQPAQSSTPVHQGSSCVCACAHCACACACVGCACACAHGGAR